MFSVQGLYLVDGKDGRIARFSYQESDLSDMRLNILHEIFAKRCNDLIGNYLQHIKSVWGYILNEDAQLIKKMDHTCV